MCRNAPPNVACNFEPESFAVPLLVGFEPGGPPLPLAVGALRVVLQEVDGSAYEPAAGGVEVGRSVLCSASGTTLQTQGAPLRGKLETPCAGKAGSSGLCYTASFGRGSVGEEPRTLKRGGAAAGPLNHMWNAS